VAYAQDRIAVQVQFKKGIFECPTGDEIVDWNVGGGNEYSHTCKDGTWLNRFKEYNGVIKLDPVEYEKTDSKEMTTLKDTEVQRWLTEVRNPPPVQEPSVKDYQNMLDEKLAEVERLSTDMAKVATVAEMTAVSDKLVAQKVALDSKVAEFEAKPIEEIRK
jgi:hypothetical protein